MTRDEHRAQCIAAMIAGAKAAGLTGIQTDRDVGYAEIFTAAFDSLPSSGALVVPIEATEEMKTLWRVNPQSRGDTYAEFLAVCHAGDLTNPPEEKP